MSRADIANELARLRNAKPSTVKAFADSRAARIAELEALLLDTPEDAAPTDPSLEKLLRRSAGGDRFGK